MSFDNPYQSPSEPQQSYQEEWVGGEMQPITFDFAQVFRETNEIFKGQFIMGAAIVLLVSLFNNLVNAPSQIFNFMMQFQMIGFVEGIVLTQAWGLLTIPFTVWITIGQTIFFLKMARGENLDAMDLFKGGYCYLTALGASLLLPLVFLLICALFLTPGFVLLIINPDNPAGAIVLLIGFALFFGAMMLIVIHIWPFWFFIVDRRMKMQEAFSTALEYTASNRTNSLMLLLAGFAAPIIGLLMCCFGILVTMAWLNLLYAMCYLAMTNQPNMLQQSTGKA